MTAPLNRFAPRGPQDLADLARGHPLAWICSQGPAGQISSPLPLVPRFAPDGRIQAVEGHFARSNPHVAALQANGDAVILWMGVQGYVSPSWMADRTQAPTWNYATAQLRVTLRLQDDPEAIVRHLRELTDLQEAGRPRAWSIDDMGARLALLAQRVIAFRAEVVECNERYKLGQDERDDVYTDILAGLDAQPDAALPAWMRRFNPGADDARGPPGRRGMRRRSLLGTAIAAAWPLAAPALAGAAAGPVHGARSPGGPVPPVTPKRPLRIEQLGRVRIDDYAWLRDAHYKEFLAGQRDIDPEIRRHLEAENDYADAVLAPTRASQARWRAAMARYGVETDALPPLPRGGFVYDTRVRPGEDHVVHVRRPVGGGPEQVLLDEQARSRGQSYYRVLEAQPSPDHTLYAWLEDVHGSDRHRVCVHDVKTGEIRTWEDGYGWSGLTVSPDSQWIYWVWRDAFGRPAKTFRTPARGEVVHTLVHDQPDPTLFMALGRAASNAWCSIRVFGPDVDEWRLLPAAAPVAEPLLVQAREPGLHYQVDDWGDGRLAVLTDAGGALDGQLMIAPADARSRGDWTPLRPARDGVNILELRAFRDHLAWRQRERGRLAVVVRNRAGGEFVVDFDEEAGELEFDAVQDFDGAELRLVWQSPRTPPRWIGVDLKTGARRVLADTRVAGFDPKRYEVRRLQARAEDGATVPITLVTRRGLRADGRAPLLVYGYGAYGVSTEAAFSVPVLALVDRGWAYAIAHVRGGSEKGRRWFLDGRLSAKRNSFTDFNACTDHLVAAGYGAPGRCVAYGLSAGGLLMGGAMNLRPERYAGVIAQVPFVDMLNTMSDATHPLVPVFRVDWGDPLSDGRAYDWLASISPYENVAPAAYPMVLATAGLRDDRVSYWEPAKWVAKLRENTRSGKPVLFRVNMTGGHQASSGASDALAQWALFWAFAEASVARRPVLHGHASEGPARDSG